MAQISAIEPWEKTPTGWRPSHPHSKPQPYHRTLRTWGHSHGKTVVGILLVVVSLLLVIPFLLLPILVIGSLIEGGDTDYDDVFLNAATFKELYVSSLLFINLSLAALLPLTAIAMRYVHQLRFGWLSSVLGKFRWKFFTICLGLSLIALAAQLLVTLALPDAIPGSFDEPNAIDAKLIALLLVVLFTTPFQAAAEEYVFRGYLFQAIGSFVKNPWVAISVTALLFAMAHGLQNFPLFFDRFAFGFVAAWLVLKTGGLEAAVAMHILNNVLAFGIAIGFGSVSEALTVADISWWYMLVTITQQGVFATLVVLAAKKMGMQNMSTPPQIEDTVAEPENSQLRL